MASIDDMIKEGFNFYDPKLNVGNVVPEPGQFYKGHIKDVVVKEVNVKGKYKAKVYNFSVELSDNADRTYSCVEKESGQRKQISGKTFQGKTYKATGVFQFLNPKKGDTFEANSGGNDRYLHLCESVGAKNEKVLVEIDGEEREIVRFPDLNEYDLKGKPIDALLNYHNWKNRDGDSIKSLMVKAFKEWEGGEDRDLEVEDLPF